MNSFNWRWIFAVAKSNTPADADQLFAIFFIWTRFILKWEKCETVNNTELTKSNSAILETKLNAHNSILFY